VSSQTLVSFGLSNRVDQENVDPNDQFRVNNRPLRMLMWQADDEARRRFDSSWTAA
jgi:hypothetical protein